MWWFSELAFDKWELNKETALYLFLHKIIDCDITKRTMIKNLLNSTSTDIHAEILDICTEFDSNYVFHHEKTDDIESITKKMRTLLNNVFSKDYFSFPDEISIYPTLKCQLKCGFCFIHDKIRRESEVDNEKNIVEWKEIIRESANQGVVSFSILGGEPFLYKDLNIILNEIIRNGVRATITTNGIPIATQEYDNIFELIISSDLVTPVFSIQTLNRKNEDLMGISASISLNTLNRYLRRGKECRINSVFTRQNLDEIKAIIDFCVSVGIKRYSIAAYMHNHAGQEKYDNTELSKVATLRESIQTYLDEKNLTNVINVPVEGCMTFSTYHSKEAENLIETEFDRLYYGCGCGNTKLEILSNGDVYPCIAFNAVHKKDNLSNYASVVEMWNDSPILRELRDVKNENRPQACKKCGFISFCSGGCPFRNYTEFGTYYNHKDVNCHVNV